MLGTARCFVAAWDTLIYITVPVWSPSSSTSDSSAQLMRTLGGSRQWIKHLSPWHPRETWMEFLACGFSLSQPWLLWAFEE